MSFEGITPLIIEYRYPMLILLAFIEGPIVAFVGGILSSIGYFNPFLVCAILAGKDIGVDGVCYAIGYYGNRNKLVHHYSAKIGIREDHWNKVEELWDKRPWRTMFVSKLSYGLSLPFLISAGITHMSYKRFWFYAAQIGILQYGVLFVLGYFFGGSFSFIGQSIDLLQVGVSVVAVVALVYYFLSSFIRHRAIEENKEL